MKQDIFCALCKKRGSGSRPGYYHDKLLLGFRLHSRTLDKGWVCRDCVTKNSKLDDREFIEKIEKAIQRKS